MAPIERTALHVVIDMQTLFAEPGEWYAPALAGIVPAVARLAEHNPQATVFTRFITPFSAEQARGRWRRYYRRWSSVTLERMPPEKLDLIAPLARLVPPARVIDKTTHGAFESSEFTAVLQRARPATLIFSGVETDVCVLASVMSAIDRGYRVIVAADAVASSSPDGHRATLDAILPRFDQQAEIATVADICKAWTGVAPDERA